MKFISLIGSVFLLASCANLNNASWSSNDDMVSAFQQGQFVAGAQQSAGHNLENYARDIVAEMALNMKAVNANGIIAVTNFTNASSDYESTSELGFALGESFLRELHQFGFSTLDYKVANAVRVTSEGDFVLSRDFMELKNQVPADYVLVGTMIEHQQGVIVNARIVDLASKAILATGKSFIPRNTVNMLVTYYPTSVSN